MNCILENTSVLPSSNFVDFIHRASFHFIFFKHGNPVGKGRFSGAVTKTYTQKNKGAR